ncbi:MAG: anti sigma factor C-terminal domain-containing protein [Clostridium sp.]|uniref:anti sigma factor C-terminal domain-containing protein n=1 Tax=Clostridium sp. TaxID=1506 RepID=UPI0025C1AA9E|nr:anti sigma factor C-terminal domain-containing protein [Clostridium sp.]MCF0149432.1 anti sigma factor C-terminal domain-containing protein [Clostridium sp.]
MNKEIDDIFSDKNDDEITKELKKKRKRYNSKLITKSISLTMAILLVLGLILNVVSDKVIERSFHKQSSIFYNEYTIMHPSEYIGERRYLETGLFKSLTFFDIGKVVKEKVISAGTRNLVSGIQFGSVGGIYPEHRNYTLEEDLAKRSYNTNGLRQLCFMLPYVSYKNDINDFRYLDEIDNNKYIEMVLSFDKEYSYEDVNKSFGSDNISFYWIDMSTDEQKSYYEDEKAYLTENEVIGIKSITGEGKLIVDENGRLIQYREAIAYLKDNKYRSHIEIRDGSYTNISGVVVQGTAEELKKLESNSMIKHAILGNIVDKF